MANSEEKKQYELRKYIIKQRKEKNILGRKLINSQDNLYKDLCQREIEFEFLMHSENECFNCEYLDNCTTKKNINEFKNIRNNFEFVLAELQCMYDEYFYYFDEKEEKEEK